MKKSIYKFRLGLNSVFQPKGNDPKAYQLGVFFGWLVLLCIGSFAAAATFKFSWFVLGVVEWLLK